MNQIEKITSEIIKFRDERDWAIKENVRAKMRVAIKRLLRKYGYPPDMQLLATETVIKQAEMISAALINRVK